MARTAEAHNVHKLTIEDSYSEVVYTTKLHIPDDEDQDANGFHTDNYGVCDSSHNESGLRDWVTQNQLQTPIFWLCANPAGKRVVRMKKSAAETSVVECELPKDVGQTESAEFPLYDEKCKMKIENEGKSAGNHGCTIRKSKEHGIRTKLV